MIAGVRDDTTVEMHPCPEDPLHDATYWSLGVQDCSLCPPPEEPYDDVECVMWPECAVQTNKRGRWVRCTPIETIGECARAPHGGFGAGTSTGGRTGNGGRHESGGVPPSGGTRGSGGTIADASADARAHGGKADAGKDGG
jgi:hypothetical protein